MNPYVAEALAALQQKGYSATDAQAIIDRFLATNPQDEHRLFAALDLGTSAVTGQTLLAAAQSDSALAERAYVRNLIPANLTTTEFFQARQPSSGLVSWDDRATRTNWLIPLALAGAAAYFFYRRA